MVKQNIRKDSSSFRKKSSHVGWKSRFALIRLVFLVIVIFIITNVGIVVAIRFFLKAQSACLTKDEIINSCQSAGKCYYIYDNKYYGKGKCDEPHQGHPCGMDITSIIPTTHKSFIDIYLTPNYKGEVCSGTPVPTPYATPYETPYIYPTPGNAYATPYANPTPTYSYPTPAQATPPTGGANIKLKPTPNPALAVPTLPITASPTILNNPTSRPISDTGFGGMIADNQPIPEYSNQRSPNNRPPINLVPTPYPTLSPKFDITEMTRLWSKIIAYAAFGIVILTGISWIVYFIWQKLSSK